MLPQNVNPMLCRLVRDSFSRPGWIYEVQWDWFQTRAEVGAAGVGLTSRNQNSFNKRFNKVVKALERLKHDAVLDGEIVALDEGQHTSFEWWFTRNGQRRGRLVYYVFDLLFLDGETCERCPSIGASHCSREKKFPASCLWITSKSMARNSFAWRRNGGREGIVAKNPNSQRKEPAEFRIEKRRF